MQKTNTYRSITRWAFIGLASLGLAIGALSYYLTQNISQSMNIVVDHNVQDVLVVQKARLAFQKIGLHFRNSLLTSKNDYGDEAIDSLINEFNRNHAFLNEYHETVREKEILQRMIQEFNLYVGGINEVEKLKVSGARAEDIYKIRNELTVAHFDKVEQELNAFSNYKDEVLKTNITSARQFADRSLKLLATLPFLIVLFSALSWYLLRQAYKRSYLLELKTQKQHDDHRMILDSVPSLIWYKDASNRIIRCNQLAAKSIGKQVSEVEGHFTEEFYPDEAETYHQDDLEVIRSAKSKLGIIEPYQSTDAKKRWMQTDKIPHINDKGVVDGVIVCALDITKLKETESNLSDAIKSRDAFISMASHELKTPITALKLSNDLINRTFSHELSPKLIELSASMTEQVNRLTKLVDNMLDVTRISSNSFQLDIECVDLQELLQKQIAIVTRDKANAPAIGLRVDKPIHCFCDRSRIEQVVSNLLSNAVKYGDGEPIQVRLRSAARWINIDIEDRGQGIRSEDQERIFHRFERAVNENAASGLGLGLYVAHQIISAHGGHINISSSEEQGSTFTVELPLERGSGEDFKPFSFT